MTARLAQFFSFPLLAKELTEAAARRRTYVTRVLYALLLYTIFALTIPRWLWRPGVSPWQAMGIGRQLFEQLCLLQACGIALFLPTLMCGRIAQEKERDSLVLLLLTELKPWQIILQKYAGGLVPMLTFLLIGMPLAAIAYAFGGITAAKLFGYLYALIVLCLQIGAIALLCSAWFRTTVGAFLATYFIGAVFYAGPPLAFEVIRHLFDNTYGSTSSWWEYEKYSFLLIPIMPVEEAISTSGSLVFFDWQKLAFWSVPSLLSIPFFLCLAHFFLVRRAFTPPGNFLLKIFRRLDGMMKRSNHLVGNVVLIRERENLPGDAPIYWRETARRALGKVHYLVRILVVVEIPTIFLCGLIPSIGYSGQSEELSVIAAFLFGLAAIALSVQAANTIVSERIQQTLEVLLTTPLSGREIVLEKARALRRLALVAAIPLLTVFGTECWLETGMGRNDRGDGWLAYLVCAVLMVAIYLPMITWLSVWIGLRVRTRFRAIITALVTLVLWCGLPPAILMAIYLNIDDGPYPEWPISIALLSPLTVGFGNEGSSLHQFPWNFGTPWSVILVNAAFYAAITLLIRRHALANADRWMRR